MQEVGQLSQAGLGWAGYGIATSLGTMSWCAPIAKLLSCTDLPQFRVLKSHLAKYKTSTGARVIWMSSHEANPIFYDPSDWQLTNTEHSYESSKFQMDLIAHLLDQASFQEESDGLPVRHLTVLPGVAGTNIANVLLGTLSSIGMLLAFYIVSYHWCS